MTDPEIAALLEAHEAIIVEREDWKHTADNVDSDDLFSGGNVNGLNEARNRVEELIQERSTVTESDVAEYYGEKVRDRTGSDSE